MDYDRYNQLLPIYIDRDEGGGSCSSPARPGTLLRRLGLMSFPDSGKTSRHNAPSGGPSPHYANEMALLLFGAG